MLNKVQLIGYVGRDAELRYTQGGSAVANFSLATSEKWRKDGEQHERTEWHRIQTWGPLAEKLVGPYVTKGRLVYVEGRIQTREWEDKEGEKRRTTEIVAQTVQLLGGKGDGSRSRQDDGDPGYEPDSGQGGVGGAGDDIPF